MDIIKSLKQIDSLYAAGNLKQAENCLDLWLTEALKTDNYPAALTFFNEMEGLYRTTGRAEKAAEISDRALKLVSFMGLDNTVHHATTLQNGATANRVAGNLDKSLEMYKQAAEIYKHLNDANTYQIASLYHNISHIYQQKKRHSEALKYLEQALLLITQEPDSEAEIATTNVCMALSYMALGNMQHAELQLAKAMKYYESESGKQDGHYGSALSAMGEFYWRKKDYRNAVMYLEKALDFTYNRFGENQGCQVIRKNLDTIKNEINNCKEDD